MERRNIYTFCSISLCCNVTKDDYSDDEYDVGDGGQLDQVKARIRTNVDDEGDEEKMLMKATMMIYI